LTPKDSSQLFDRLILEFNQQSLVRMAISDASGLTTEITFSAVETNPDIKNSMFVFEAPQGVDIIDSRP
jgi:outer membrane lipoprotein carrier protein